MSLEENKNMVRREHWAMRDDLSLLNQLGLLPAGMIVPTYQ